MKLAQLTHEGQNSTCPLEASSVTHSTLAEVVVILEIVHLTTQGGVTSAPGTGGWLGKGVGVKVGDGTGVGKGVGEITGGTQAVVKLL